MLNDNPAILPVTVIVPVGVPQVGCTTSAVGADGLLLGAGVTDALAVLVHPFNACVAVNAEVEITVRGLPLPPSLQASAAPLRRPVTVSVELPSQLSTLLSVGAPGVGLTVSVTGDFEKTDGFVLLATFAYTMQEPKLHGLLNGVVRLISENQLTVTLL